MPQRTYDPTEQLGVNEVQRIVAKQIRWIWREQFGADFGIDGQIEIVGHDKKPTGRLIAVQVKSGASYFKGRSATAPFYVGDDHLKYWDQHALPVILVLHNPKDAPTANWRNGRLSAVLSENHLILTPNDSAMTDIDYRTYYDLEQYLFGEAAISLRSSV